MMRVSRLRLLSACTVLILALGVPGTSDAELTDAERAELRGLVDAASDIRAGIRSLADALQAGTTVQSRPLLAEALMRAIAASAEDDRALAFFLGTTAVMGGQGDMVRAWPRANFLEQAWFHHARAGWRLEQAEAYIDEAARLHGGNRAYQRALGVARGLNFARARARLDALDQTLAYLDPLPPDAPRIVGPHGVYERAQHRLWRANVYAHDMLARLTAMYAADQLLEDYRATGRMFREGTFILDAQTRAQALMAGVATTDAEADLFDDPRLDKRDFLRVLHALNIMTTSAPQRYHAVNLSMRSHIDALVTRPEARHHLVRAYQRFSDAWRMLDFGTWQALIFPDLADRLERLRSGEADPGDVDEDDAEDPDDPS